MEKNTSITVERIEPRKTIADVLSGWGRVWSRLYRRDLTEEDFAIYDELLVDLAPDQLDAACRAASPKCTFLPTPAEIRAQIDGAMETATEQAAEVEWGRVLDLRRLYWSPDLEGGFSRGMPKLSERVQQAARASGVFRDFESVDGLYVWAKKRFVESFVAYGELEQDGFLLPDGEIKDLLAEFSQAKALPAPQYYFEDLHLRGLEYAERTKGLAPSLEPLERTPIRKTPPVIDFEGRRAVLQRQAEMIRKKYANSTLADKVAVWEER